MKRYSINEIFLSIQGEGANAGKTAVFVRFSGCNLHCPFCDTKHEARYLFTADEIVDAITRLWKDQTIDPFVVLTGGEPTLQVDADLICKLHRSHAYIAIETNGTLPVPCTIDFITVSPKADFVKQTTWPTDADELKLVFDGTTNPNVWFTRIKAKHYFLQPCDTGNEKKNSEITEKLFNFVLLNPVWKISLQMQKILNVR